MERTQKPDTAYQDDSKRAPVSPPRFTAGAARRARQVVALRPDFMKPIHQVWESLGTGAYRRRTLAGIVLVALAGGVAGGLLAAANNDHEPGINVESLTAGADAGSQTESSQPVSRPKEPERISQPADSGPTSTFERREMERAVAELQNRRSPSPKKAYRVAVIYPGDSGDPGRGRRRVRKH